MHALRPQLTRVMSGLASVSSATVISSSTATTASGDSDGSSTVVIVVVVLVVILCFGVIGFLVWYFMFKSTKVVPTQVAIIQPDDVKRDEARQDYETRRYLMSSETNDVWAIIQPNDVLE